MTLFKTSILSFIATIIRIFSGLVINKTIAVFIGPSGLAIIGQLQNFIQISNISSQGAIATGVTKYVADHRKNNPEKVLPLIATATKITLTCSVVVSLVLILFSSVFSNLIFGSTANTIIFILLGASITLFALNSLILAILNGLGMVKDYVIINIIQSLSSLFYVCIMIYFYDLQGALIALSTAQSLVFIIIAIKFRKKFNEIKNVLSQPFEKEKAQKLSKYMLMALTSIIVVPTSQILIRNHIGENIGWDEAGYWQGLIYLSNTYLMVITTSLSLYFLPKLSELTKRSHLISELKKGYTLLIPMAIISALGIYLFRDLIIKILFSDDFLGMSDLFFYQLIGDVFKIMSWLIGYILISKAATKSYIITEVLFSTSFVILSFILTDKFGLIGVTYAYCINYLMHVPTITIIGLNILRKIKD